MRIAPLLQVTIGLRAVRFVPIQFQLSSRLRRGLETSSPPQVGQILCISSAHAEQKLHSFEQIKAGPSCASEALQRLQADFI
jgi:hypothetical protein